MQKKKEQEKYRRKLEKGQVKPVAELSSREHRKQKKVWRINTRKYYERKKKEVEELGECHSISGASNSDSTPQLRHLKSIEKNRKKKNEEERRRKTSKLKSPIENLQRKVRKLKRREDHRLNSNEKNLGVRFEKL